MSEKHREATEDEHWERCRRALDAGEDSEAVTEAYAAITRRLSHHRIGTLSQAQAALYRIWHAYCITQNGGFKYFFEHLYSADHVADNLDFIGCPTAAELFRQAVAVFPGDRPHDDFWDRMDHLAQIEERTGVDAFRKLDDLLFEQEDAIVEGLMCLIREHRNEIVPAGVR